MAIISINPDADGDLHDASLHNVKFQTILNEMNGNLDAANLAAPKSIIHFPFSARSGVLAGGGTNLTQIPWATTVLPTARDRQMETAAPLYNYGVITSVNGCHIYLNSITANLTGEAMVLVANGGTITWQATNNFTNSVIIVYFQKAANIASNAWEDMAFATINPHIAANAENRSSTFTTIDATLPANHFFRVLVQNNPGVVLITAGNPQTGPPLSSGAAFFSVLHVA